MKRETLGSPPPDPPACDSALWDLQKGQTAMQHVAGIVELASWDAAWIHHQFPHDVQMPLAGISTLMMFLPLYYCFKLVYFIAELLLSCLVMPVESFFFKRTHLEKDRHLMSNVWLETHFAATQGFFFWSHYKCGKCNHSAVLTEMKSAVKKGTNMLLQIRRHIVTWATVHEWTNELWADDCESSLLAGLTQWTFASVLQRWRSEIFGSSIIESLQSEWTWVASLLTTWSAIFGLPLESLLQWPELPRLPAKPWLKEWESVPLLFFFPLPPFCWFIHSKSCLISRLCYMNTLRFRTAPSSMSSLFPFFYYFYFHQGALPAGRQTRRLQVPASIQLRAVLRSPAAQREDEGGAGEGVQEGRGRSAWPAGYRPLPVAGLLHPHTCWNQSGKPRRVHKFTAINAF